MLSWIGRRGSLGLVVGLLCGLGVPDLAQSLRPWVTEVIAAMLMVSGIRIGARQALSGLGHARDVLRTVLVLQLVLPILVACALRLAGLADAPLALALTLMLAAPSVTGAPSFAIMAGYDPAPGMRLLIVGTVLFPVTALPVLAILGLGDTPFAAPIQSAWLAAMIGMAVGTGFALRALRPALADPILRPTLDGASTVFLGIAVVGLMSEIGPLLRTDPIRLLPWIAAAIVVNFGLQFLARRVLSSRTDDDRVAISILAGNRNIALFLFALPPDITAPLMIFIGCYQIPMYLTPTMLRLHRSPG